jgi:hypothetical protein
MFSQLPTVFALRFTQNSLQIGQRPATRFRTGKAWSNTGMQSKKSLGPVANIDRGRSGSSKGGMLVLLHELLLSDITFWIAFSLSSVSHLKEEDYAASPTFLGRG